MEILQFLLWKSSISLLPRHSGTLRIGLILAQGLCLFAGLVVRASSWKLLDITTTMWSAEGAAPVAREVAAMTRGVPGKVAATTRGMAVDVAPMSRKVAPMTGMTRTFTRFAAPRAVLELLTLLLLSTILASTRPEGTVCSLTFLVSTVLHAFVGTAAVGVSHTKNLHANAALTCRIARSVSFNLTFYINGRHCMTLPEQ